MRQHAGSYASPHYRAYLVRLSRADATSAWRIVAKDVETSEEFPLPDLAGVSDFLRRQISDDPIVESEAFVVQVHATAAVAQRQFAGRVEHVPSGRAIHFQTVDDLLAFIARVLTGPQTRPGEPCRWHASDSGERR